ncbi:PEP-CTERM-box response regulator transcription factor [Methyloversatilis discipulorum]|uniref:PEP-CTERM-box response regulator transcription factor n=1 Tax=Methyloversatilis discipulorum TaxID=1119528 RepID=UPI003AF6AB53
MADKGRTLLIVEDDPALQKQMRWSFDDYEVVLASDRESALAQIRRHEPAVITMDLGLPPAPDDVTEGMALLGEIMALAPQSKVIVLIERAFRLHDLQTENTRLANQNLGVEGRFITRDANMLRVLRTIEKVSATRATVLLLGESGTGKEVLAKTLHDRSERAGERFVAINCAAIPDNLLESELFGYEKGAFTGATKQTPGKIEVANKGTLFLDEIGDLPGPLQAKLLRFLQERVIERLGGRDEIPIDVRVVCATHQNLQTLIGESRFREDLYYRLAEIVVTIPPLREREGDAALLAHSFVKRFAGEQGRSSMSLSREAVAAIEAHKWPGNVRELENCIKRATIMADGNQIMVPDLGLKPAEENGSFFNLRQIREEAERKAVVSVLARVDGNMVKAAEMLGVSRPTLYDLMNRFGLR